jgi:hypothetical protein
VATSVPARDIELVRGFNRLVTRRLGALDDPYANRWFEKRLESG